MTSTREMDNSFTNNNKSRFKACFESYRKEKARRVISHLEVANASMCHFNARSVPISSFLQVGNTTIMDPIYLNIPSEEEDDFTDMEDPIYMNLNTKSETSGDGRKAQESALEMVSIRNAGQFQGSTSSPDMVGHI